MQVFGTPERTRTSGLLLRRQALYPLSYGRTTTVDSIAESSRGDARSMENRTSWQNQEIVATIPRFKWAAYDAGLRRLPRRIDGEH